MVWRPFFPELGSQVPTSWAFFHLLPFPLSFKHVHLPGKATTSSSVLETLLLTPEPGPVLSSALLQISVFDLDLLKPYIWVFPSVWKYVPSFLTSQEQWHLLSSYYKPGTALALYIYWLKFTPWLTLWEGYYHHLHFTDGETEQATSQVINS